VLNVAKPSPESTLLISGMGGVGMAALFAAVSLGVKTIIAVDTIDSRLELVST
jgi:Zn-dependent alcohol dehydrogenase